MKSATFSTDRGMEFNLVCWGRRQRLFWSDLSRYVIMYTSPFFFFFLRLMTCIGCMWAYVRTVCAHAVRNGTPRCPMKFSWGPPPATADGHTERSHSHALSSRFYPQSKKKKNGRFDHTNQTVPPHRLHLFFISFITPWAGPTGGLLLPMPSWTTFTEADFDGLLVRSEQM